MLKKDQLELTENYVQAVIKVIKEEIEKGKIPESWDGFELRWYIADAFKQESFHRKDLNKRNKEYQNYKNTHNLVY